MPSRNTIKTDVPHSYYHVYARGASKQRIFLDAKDFEYFKSLFARYLTRNNLSNINGEPYPYHGESLELLCFCFMPNHFHLLIYQHTEGAMSKLMRSLMTSYSMYFNKKYRRTGSLFESRYKASRIERQEYLEHITRYIHLNPRYWQHYKHSSIAYYSGQQAPVWIKPGRILEIFPSVAEYVSFVSDYEENKHMFDIIKAELADS